MDAPDPHILSDLRMHDRMRYLASLLLDDKYRTAIMTLYAFDAEISRIRSLIKEPLPGEIRLQWWREVTAGDARKDEAAANPLAHLLNQVIDQYHLDRSTFDGYCRARIFDLYDDPMPDKHSFEGHSGETNSMLFQWSCQIIDPDLATQTADVSGHAGIAQTVAIVLAQLSIHSARGQIYIPLELLQDAELDREQFLNGQEHAKIDKGIHEFVDFGADHLKKARQAAQNMPQELQPAFLPLAICDRIYARSHRFGAKCLTQSPAPAIWLSQWDLWCRARRGDL